MRRLLGIVLLWVSMAAGQAVEPPQFFHIQPVRPVEELRREAIKAQPPLQSGDFLKPDLVELVKLDPSIKLDIRYATSRNFLSTPVYDEAKAFMQRPAAEAVARASQQLHEKGFGLLIYDAYRPWYVTKIFWDATPVDKHQFVADPAKGSQHNRGCAVDLTMVDLKTGEPVPMTGLYDEMSERSYPNYKGGSDEERRNRETLRAAMEAEGFTVYDYEWWHFDYKDYKKYPVLNLKFEDLTGGTGAAQDSPTKVYLIGKDVKAPKPYFTPWPTLQSPGPKVKRGGTVALRAIIDSSGDVVRAEVVRSLSPELDAAAIEAVRKWKFHPATRNKQPVVVQIHLEVNFILP